MRTYFYIFSSMLFSLLPFSVYAQGYDPSLSLIVRIGGWVNAATPVAIGIALLVFFWGLAKLIFSAGDEEKRSEGKKVMGWGIIALFVVVSIWGIVFFLADSLDVGVGGSAPTPCVEGVAGCTPFGGGGGGGTFGGGIYVEF